MSSKRTPSLLQNTQLGDSRFYQTIIPYKDRIGMGFFHIHVITYIAYIPPYVRHRYQIQSLYVSHRYYPLPLLYSCDCEIVSPERNTNKKIKSKSYLPKVLFEVDEVIKWIPTGAYGWIVLVEKRDLLNVKSFRKP